MQDKVMNSTLTYGLLSEVNITGLGQPMLRSQTFRCTLITRGCLDGVKNKVVDISFI